jgi:hypothetical protein
MDCVVNDAEVIRQSFEKKKIKLDFFLILHSSVCLSEFMF